MRDEQQIDAARPSILQENPNASVRTIAETLSISPETLRTDMSRIGDILRALMWIPNLNIEREDVLT
jgi:hypothetical protein